MKRNPFIVAALEELQQEQAATGGENGGGEAGAQSTDGVTAAGVTEQQQQAAQAAGEVTEVNMDSSTDAVAELMEQNTQLATENAELQNECFDNDADVIESASDSVQEDLNEAVAAGAALEELAHLAELTVKSGQANRASVAGLAFGLEQITDRIGVKSLLPALEAEGGEPEEQAASIGEKAKTLAANIGKKLVEGIKRIIQAVMSFFRNLFTNTGKVAEKAKELRASLSQIDDSKEITDQGFIKSLRIPEGNDSVAEYYYNFHVFAQNALNFFDADFSKLMEDMFEELRDTKQVSAPWDRVILPVVKAAQEDLFPFEPRSGSIDGAPKGNDIDVWATPQLVGGVQLYMAWRQNPSDAKEIMLKIGRASDPKLRAPESIPVLSAKDADKLLQSVERWMSEFRSVQKSLSRLERLGQGVTERHWSGQWSTTYNHVFLSMFSGLAANTLPHVLNLCMMNAKRINAYVEKSIAVSKAVDKAEK
ncbi:hypothetical protein [Ralstonia phage RP31]|uniref:Uncharacterized protein n=2 Tax=Ripduovirus RP12 TaxID=2560700 RepID=A0A1L7N155_9CAUD|nr:hypothetical protein FDH28_gp183 [Ralstonia phage RP12]BAW19212.1 hypothetical protein [Ralstonia phage RP12]BAW19498.1 hypothetical protein [Ralstonia phage RP31]